MSSNNEQRTHVTNYEGTDIYVDANGMFYATPPGCRKERSSYYIVEIREEITKVVDRARQNKRKDANYSVHIFDTRTGIVDVNAIYIGVRGKSSKFGDAGHVFQLNGLKTTRERDLRIVPSDVSQEEVFELEAAFEVMRATRKEYEQLLAKSTRRVNLGYFSNYDVTAERLIRDQDALLRKIRKAQQPSAIETSSNS
jgi:hypothetical protein